MASHQCTIQHSLSMKQGSLFCFVVMRPTEPGCFRLCCWCLWKALNEEGCTELGSMMFGRMVQKFLNMEWFLQSKLKLNRSWRFQRNWNVPLVFLERSWWAGFNGIYLVRFGFRMWERLIFKCDFCSWKFKKIPKNQVLGRKN